MEQAGPPPGARRSFLAAGVQLLGALAAGILAFPAVAFLIDPRHRASPRGDFQTVARLGDLPIGTPVMAVIRDARRDMWTLHPNEVIGRVWLIRRDADQVEAFTTICPHLGCSINFDGKLFICPCHNGAFHLSGERMSAAELGRANPAPRGMDSLEVRRSPDNPDLIQVKYESFQQGRETKERRG